MHGGHVKGVHPQVDDARPPFRLLVGADEAGEADLVVFQHPHQSGERLGFAVVLHRHQGGAPFAEAEESLVGAQQILDSHDADHAVIAGDHRQGSDVALVKEVEGVVQRGDGGEEVVGAAHDLPHRGRLKLGGAAAVPFVGQHGGGHGAAQIPVRYHAQEVALVVDHWQVAAMVLRQQLSRLGEQGAGGNGDGRRGHVAGDKHGFSPLTA